MTKTFSGKRFMQAVALIMCVFTFVFVAMAGNATTAYCDMSNWGGNNSATTPTSGDTSTALGNTSSSSGTASTGITNAVNSITNQVYKIVRSVVVPFCIVALAFAGFQFLIGGNQGAEKARKVVIGCICAIGFVVFAPMVVQVVSGLVASEGSNDMEDYNSL